jgi:hypothetical protein
MTMNFNSLAVEERKQYKLCRKCFMLKHNNLYYKNTDSKDGKRPECMECTRELSKKYYTDNIEEFKIRDKMRVFKHLIK